MQVLSFGSVVQQTSPKFSLGFSPRFSLGFSIISAISIFLSPLCGLSFGLRRCNCWCRNCSENPDVKTTLPQAAGFLFAELQVFLYKGFFSLRRCGNIEPS